MDIAEGRRLLAAATGPKHPATRARDEDRLAHWLVENAEALLAGTPDLDVAWQDREPLRLRPGHTPHPGCAACAALHEQREAPDGR